MAPVERRILVKVANMYYMEGLKQSDIATRIGIDRTTVSKYLKKARKEGLVKITVEHDSYDELEAAMEARFGLKESYIVPKSYDLQVIKKNMAGAGLNLLRRHPCTRADYRHGVGHDRARASATRRAGGHAAGRRRFRAD